MSDLNLDELNKQMLFFQNDYNNSSGMSVNFPDASNLINNSSITTQIKRPTKSGSHRNEINDKLTQMNMSMPLPPLISQPNNNVMINSRNNSSYNQNNSELNGSENRFASYYNHNFDTLQNINPSMQSSARNNSIVFNKSTNLNPLDTHDQGVTFINVNNLLTGQSDINSNRINETGYHPIEEKKMDYRQNMNNKIDNFIFNNPFENNYVNPILLAARNNSNNNNAASRRDSRMVIQDSSKDFYRQEANSRLSQYSPLSRASNIPIDIANLSVNDFYSGNNSNISQHVQEDDDQKALINARMSQYAPLAKTVQYQTQQNQQNQQKQQNQSSYMNSQPSQSQSNNSNYESMIKFHQQQLKNYYNQQNMQNQEKPKHWQTLDANPNLFNKQLPVYDQYPVISNKNY